MTGCPDCWRAEREPYWGYWQGCPRCDARHLAREPWIRAEQMLQTLPEGEREERRRAAIDEYERVRAKAAG